MRRESSSTLSTEVVVIVIILAALGLAGAGYFFVYSYLPGQRKKAEKEVDYQAYKECVENVNISGGYYTKKALTSKEQDIKKKYGVGVMQEMIDRATKELKSSPVVFPADAADSAAAI